MVEIGLSDLPKSWAQPPTPAPGSAIPVKEKGNDVKSDIIGGKGNEVVKLASCLGSTLKWYEIETF